MKGKKKLENSTVLLQGQGSPAATYLAIAGVGEIIIVDDDNIQESNRTGSSFMQQHLWGNTESIFSRKDTSQTGSRHFHHRISNKDRPVFTPSCQDADIALMHWIITRQGLSCTIRPEMPEFLIFTGPSKVFQAADQHHSWKTPA